MVIRKSSDSIDIINSLFIIVLIVLTYGLLNVNVIVINLTWDTVL